MRKLLYYLSIVLFAVGCNQPSQQPASKDSAVTKQALHCAPQVTDKDWYTSGAKAPLFKGLEGIHFQITTTNKLAQDYFNQGLMLSYGFNHAEAARSFFEATRIDSTCAMAFWGYAYVLGPNYNAGMEKDNYERAYAAAQKAVVLMKHASPKEQALINALTYRYAATAPENRSSLDIAYSAAMKKVYEQFPTDPDVSALYAESMLDMHPWDLYDKKTKAPRPWTPEIVTVLEHLVKLYPKHPGAPHFYIHAVEASQHPERALDCAKLLLTLVPGAGHMVHMPAHIYIWTGDYHLASLANIEAIKIDSNYITACHAQGAYPLAYFPHNYHYLAATATFEGNSALAWMAAKKVQENTAVDIMKEPGWGTLQHYYTIPYYVAVKFSMWDTILSIPLAEKELAYPQAILHYARGMAYVSKNDIAKAQTELISLQKLSSDTSLKEITIWDINSTYELVQIAVKVLSAEISQQQQLYDKAITLLNEAVVLEDDLNYDEPPDWFFSVRHQLGAVLLKAGKYGEAEKVYLEDLAKYKENGWALSGLFQALQKQGKEKPAEAVYKRFAKSWQYADFKLLAAQ